MATQCARRAVVVLLAAVAALVGAPAAAQAGAGLGATPSFPGAVNVGQTGVPASLTLVNRNTNDPDAPPDDGATVCRHDDPPTPPLDQCFMSPGLLLTPSCGFQLGTPTTVCKLAGIDPDVLRISPTATGAALNPDGTVSVCASMAFTTVAVPGDPFGKYRFDPPPGQHIVLPAIGDKCTISFTFDVLKLPTIDIRTAIDGLQTAQIVEAIQQSDAGNLGSGQGTQTPMTVNPVLPGCEPTNPGTCERFTAGRVTMVAEAPATGCRKRPFRVVVRGRFINSVVFLLDGKRMTRRTRPNYRLNSFSVRVRPSALRSGRHRITTLTRFAPETGTKSTTLRTTFQTCA